MRAADILTRLTADGITLEVSGTRLLAMPADRLTDHHRDLIRSNKAALLRLLSDPRRLWDIVEPSGVCWRSSFCPHCTQAQVSGWYPGATVTPAPETKETQP